MKKSTLILLSLSFVMAFHQSFAQCAALNCWNNNVSGPQNSAVGGGNYIASGSTGYVTAGCFISGYANCIKHSGSAGSPESNSSHAMGGFCNAGGASSFAMGLRVLAGTTDPSINASAATCLFKNNSIGIGRDITVWGENAMAIGSGLWNATAHSTDLVNNTPNSLVIAFNHTTTTRPTFFLKEPTSGGSVYDDYGSIGIGTNDPKGHTLAVRGDVIAEKMQVALFANWPDYVFENKYKLMGLYEVDIFIKENHHLPNIPSAETIKNEGYDLADMDAKLLEKIEELTLHMIDLKKQTEELKKENELLKSQLKK